MKIRTENQLCEAIDSDLIWRKRELTNTKFLLASSLGRPDIKMVVLRGSVTLLYAHWEGFVKRSSQCYLEYVASQNVPNADLIPPLLALSLRSHFAAVSAGGRLEAQIALLDFLRTSITDKSKIPHKDGVRTKANLSSKVLRDVLLTLGLDFSPYATKANLIDEALLKCRNTIAHGEFLIVTQDKFDNLHTEILQMMETLRSQIQNAAALRLYLSKSALLSTLAAVP